MQEEPTSWLEEFKAKVDSMSKEEFEQVWEKYRVEEEGGPVSIWHDASDKPNIKEKSGIFVITSLNGEYIGSRYYNHNDITITLGNYDKWAYLNDLLNLSNVQRTGKNLKEPVSEDLGGYINELSKQFPEVSFAKLSRIAVRVAKWHKEQMMAKAIDAELCSDGMFTPLINVNDKEKISDIKFGDKVKVILLKK